MVPPVRGVDHRIINGYVYISPVPVKDGAEICCFAFMERAGCFYDNSSAEGEVEGQDGGHDPRAEGAVPRASRTWRR